MRETIVAENISKSFYHPVKAEILKGINLTVKQGETVAIMGRSGEGKSTLLNILGTLETPCQGTLKIAGHCTRGAPWLRNKHIGFVFQSFHLLEDYTVLENILMPARIARKSVNKKSEIYAKACELLEIVGLTNRAHFFAKHLSGGEKQRATIARALCNDPSLVLADEPSGNLDSVNASQIHELLLRFVKERKKSLIVVTHDQQLANLCETKYALNRGHLSPL